MFIGKRDLKIKAIQVLINNAGFSEQFYADFEFKDVIYNKLYFICHCFLGIGIK